MWPHSDAKIEKLTKDRQSLIRTLGTRPGCQRSCSMGHERRDPPAFEAPHAAEANLIRGREDLFSPDDAALRRKPDRSRARSTPAAGRALALSVKVIFKNSVLG